MDTIYKYTRTMPFGRHPILVLFFEGWRRIKGSTKGIAPKI